MSEPKEQPPQAPPSTPGGDKPLVVDEVELLCKACGRSRTFVPDRLLTGARALVAWLDEQLPAYGPCACGSTVCDIKARLVDSERGE